MTDSTPAVDASTPIADYALLGDTRGSALVSSAGSIDWLAWPRFDSAATFIRLLDRQKGGASSLAASGLRTLGREYDGDTTILVSHFATDTGSFDVTDFMTVSDLDPVPERGADNDAPGRLVRIITGVTGDVDVTVTVHPTFDFARAGAADVAVDGPAATFRSGEHGLSARSSGAWITDLGRAATVIRVTPGETGFVVLGHGLESGTGIGDATAAADYASTRAYWTAWSSRCTYDGEHRAAVLRSVLTLKALTYAPSGAIVAAATAGLPEAPGGDRNYDYRYTWLRDAAFAIGAFLDLGYEREGQEFLRFVSEADASEGTDLQIFYPIDGGKPTDPQQLDLEGYESSLPVTIGNDASDQAQHEIYSEILCALHNVWEVTGHQPLAGVGGHRMDVVVRNVVTQVEKTWKEPDRSIWENRDGDQHFFHSKAMSWVAMDRAVKLADMLEMPERDAWRELADTIRDDYTSHGWNDTRRAYTQALGSDVIDAAVLRTVLFGALPADDVRMRDTMSAIRHDLVVDDLVYRYRVPDGGKGTEGAFVVCTYWLIEVLALAGQQAAAEELLGQALGRTNDVGLLSEEIEPSTGRFLGNHPQAFSHIGVVNAAVRLSTTPGASGRRGV